MADGRRDLSRRVKDAAIEAGFDAAGICDLRPVERDALPSWLARGYAGTMTYLNRQARRRQNPQRIAPHCRCAVVVLKNHYPRAAGVASEGSPGTAPARVARYAWGEDYHRVVGSQLAALAERLAGFGADPRKTRWFVDGGPVPERELAQRAGLGWIGRNTMLLHPRLGSFTFIGSVFTDLDLDPDEPFAADRCGRCRRCLDACPTAAFPADRVLDATRCISYLTIEFNGAFDAHRGRMIGPWLFGCDLCQDVCPWNLKFAAPADEPRFAARAELRAPDPAALCRMEESEFRTRYAGTAFERPGRTGLARNARQVLANRSGSR